MKTNDHLKAMMGPRLDCLQAQGAVARPAPLILPGQWSQALL